jgi:phenylalanyl-tRNA synthetase beta chain
MKVSYNWLKELVEFDLTARELADRLTMIGLAVDRVEEVNGDSVLEIDLTSNRPDCLSHFGVAREIAVLCGTELRHPDASVAEADESASSVASIEILDPDLCPRYAARMIMGVKVGPSPPWVVEKLERLGQRSINNVADITNLVLLELGHPLHAFDFNRLVGRRIVVRRARAGEMLKTLDGVKRTLKDDMLVIADATRPVAMAGVMGGEDSEISAATTDVLLESAYFDPASIRRTARALGMATEASYRFERGADYDAPVRAADRAARLIVEVAGGRILRGALDAYPRPITRERVKLRRSRLRRVVGVEIDFNEAARLLRALGFQVEAISADELWATPPSYRADVSGEDDLVEEVARHAGYEQIPTTLPAWGDAGELLAGERKRRDIRRTLASLGFSEAITFSFDSEELDALFRREETEVVTLTNPIDETRRQMRSSLLPGVLESLAHNLRHGVRSVRLFEIGKCFTGRSGEQPEETENLTLAATGLLNEDAWLDRARAFGFYELKGTLESLLERFRIRQVEFEVSPEEYLHPGQSARIRINGNAAGDFGQLHGRVAAMFKLKQPVFVAELNLGTWLEAESEAIRYRPLPKFPTVIRDISFIVPVGLKYAEIESGIESLGIAEVVAVKLFDVYSGANVPAGQRSLSISLRLRADDRTLTEGEINDISARVMALLRDRFQVVIRD